MMPPMRPPIALPPPAWFMLAVMALPMPEASATMTTTVNACVVAVVSASTSSYRGTLKRAARIMRSGRLADDAAKAITEASLVGPSVEHHAPVVAYRTYVLVSAMRTSVVHIFRAPDRRA